MNSAQTMIVDGRINLNREVLKELRRKRGISQEQVAFRCAEQRLCVSLASLKRAETNKNIIYRTARDLAEFYQVKLDVLLPKSTKNDIGKTPPPTSSFIPYNSKAVLFSCSLLLNLSDSKNYLPPTELLDLCQQELSFYNANILESFGQKVLLCFGMHQTNGNDALRALHFSVYLRTVLQAQYGYNSTIDITISLATITHTVNNEIQIDDINADALAEHKNFADHYFANKTIVSMAIKHASESFFCFKAINAQINKQSLWEMTLATSVFRQQLPFVGRKVELLQFKSVLESSSAYQLAQIVCLQGIAGHGKSRLLNEFCQLARIEGFDSYTTFILDFSSQQHQQTIPSLLRWLVNLKPSQKNLTVAQIKLHSGIDLSDYPDEFAMLYKLLDWQLSPQCAFLLNIQPQQDRIDTQCRILARIINHRSSIKPLLLCIEDLHWADEELLQTLIALMPLINQSRVVLALSSRPENEKLAAFIRYPWNSPLITLFLPPLEKANVQLLAQQFIDIDQDYLNHCIERAEGNPLFLEQLLLHKQSASELPHSIQSLVLAKINHLKENDQQALKIAAVIGQRFKLSILQNLLHQQDYSPQPLIDHYLLLSKQDEMIFCHALIQEGIYQSIIPSARCELHRLCADFYADTDCAQQAHHLHQARAKTAPKKIQYAIEFLSQQYQFDAALKFIKLAFEIDYTEYDRSQFYLLQGDTLAKLGQLNNAITAYQTACKESINTEIQVQALISQANVENTLDQCDQAIKTLETAEKIAELQKLNKLIANINYLKGNFYFPKGDIQLCEKYQKKALDYAIMVDDVEMQARSLGGLGDANYAKGKMYSAYNHIHHCLKLCNMHNLLHVKAANLFMLGTVRIYQNEALEALNDALESATLAKTVGHKRAEIVSRLTAAWVLIDQLQLNQAHEQIKLGLNLVTQIGARRFEPFLLESLSRIYLWQDKKKQAIETIDHAIKLLAEVNAETFIGPWLLSTKAMLCSQKNQANSYLKQGQLLLDKGCVGHNYYRFYIAAIESSLEFNDLIAAKDYANKLQHFTENEPTPWSEFYINRAELLISINQNRLNPDLQIKIKHTIQHAKKINLLTTIPRLEHALTI